MICPNCQEKMQVENHDNQIILHCYNCGSNFFEENGINRVTYKTAKLLAQRKKDTIIMGLQKHCPKDQDSLVSVHNDQSIPPDVSLFRCPTCSGVFTYADDLVEFKKAQNILLQYFKVWKKPLPSLQAVLVFSFLIMFSIIMLSTYTRLNQPVTNQTSAEDLIQGFNVSKTGRYVFVSFKTSQPLTSKVIFIDQITSEAIVRDISAKPQTLHYTTIGDLDISHDHTYQLILEDANGKEIKTEIKQLELK